MLDRRLCHGPRTFVMSCKAYHTLARLRLWRSSIIYPILGFFGQLLHFVCKICRDLTSFVIFTRPMPCFCVFYKFWQLMPFICKFLQFTQYSKVLQTTSCLFIVNATVLCKFFSNATIYAMTVD